MHIFFSHGRGGSPKDPIIAALSKSAQQLNFAVTLIDDHDIQDDPQRRVQRLLRKVEALPDGEQAILVGFSMGGYTSLLTAERTPRVHAQFLIAPALYLPHYPQRRYRINWRNIEIVHGWSDDKILYEHSLRFAKAANAPLHLIPGGHSLISQQERIQEIFCTFLRRLS